MKLSKYNEKVDIYSFGMILYEIICNRIPFDNLKNNAHIMSVVLDGNRPELDILDDSMLKKLIQSCWDKDPSNRPSSLQVLANLQLLSYEEPYSESLITSKYSFPTNLLKLLPSSNNFHSLELKIDSNDIHSPINLELLRLYEILRGMNINHKIVASRALYNTDIGQKFLVTQKNLKKSISAQSTANLFDSLNMELK